MIYEYGMTNGDKKQIGYYAGTIVHDLVLLAQIF